MKIVGSLRVNQFLKFLISISCNCNRGCLPHDIKIAYCFNTTKFFGTLDQNIVHLITMYKYISQGAAFYTKHL